MQNSNKTTRMSTAPTNKSPHQVLLEAVEAFLIQHKMRDYLFGRLAANDPPFVYRLRQGREPRYALREKVWKFMREYRG